MKENINLNMTYTSHMFVTHYLIYDRYKLPTAEFLQHTLVFMKATSAGASRMMTVYKGL